MKNAENVCKFGFVKSQVNALEGKESNQIENDAEKVCKQGFVKKQLDKIERGQQSQNDSNTSMTINFLTTRGIFEKEQTNHQSIEGRITGKTMSKD
ncbi:hypothetical protein [Rickettsiella massiliensis]|uniref:hypothetical protein n=1 Tax=Rickettsiella massiliensis TaxID=676517 RepID=UPI0004955C48|nr:hypothetical protein [Rickettsiella massiliensis]